MIRSSTLLVALLLSACASIPLTTAARLASFDGESLAELDGEWIRVRVAVPAEFGIDPARTKLTLELADRNAQSIARNLDLRELSRSNGERSLGPFSGDVAVAVHELALTPESVAEFAELQRFAAENRLGKFTIGVSANFRTIPAGSRQLRIWTEIKLRRTDEYMTLIDGAEIDL